MVAAEREHRVALNKPKYNLKLKREVKIKLIKRKTKTNQFAQHGTILKRRANVAGNQRTQERNATNFMNADTARRSILIAGQSTKSASAKGSRRRINESLAVGRHCSVSHHGRLMQGVSLQLVLLLQT